MRKTETAGLTLLGAIDGTNRRFTTSLPMDLDHVDWYLNGRLKNPVLDDGYTLPNDRTILTREPPLPGDTVQVSYATNATPGGQAGGVPQIGSVDVIEPPCAQIRYPAPPVGWVHQPCRCLAEGE